MSVKGDFRFKALGYVHLRQWYTGLRFKVREDKAHLYKSKDGIMVLAEKKDAILDN